MATLPTTPKYVTDDLVSIFQEGIDQLIFDLGRNITVHMKPSIIDCPNCFKIRIGGRIRSSGKYNTSNPNAEGGPLNKPFGGGVCPVCRGSGIIETTNDITVKCLIKWSPDELQIEYGQSRTINICRLKCLMENNLSYMKNAISVQIDSETCKLIKGPIKGGLRDLRYIKTYFEKIDNT